MPPESYRNRAFMSRKPDRRPITITRWWAYFHDARTDRLVRRCLVEDRLAMMALRQQGEQLGYNMKIRPVQVRLEQDLGR